MNNNESSDLFNAVGHETRIIMRVLIYLMPLVMRPDGGTSTDNNGCKKL